MQIHFLWVTDYERRAFNHNFIFHYYHPRILGVEVAFALAGVSVIFTFLLMGSNGLYTMATTVISQITDTTLVTIPLLVLMGQFVLKSGIADRLFHSANYWLNTLFTLS